MDYKALVATNNQRKKELEEKLNKLKDAKARTISSQMNLNNKLADIEKKILDTEEELENIELEIIKAIRKNSKINFSDPDVLEAVVTVGEEKTQKKKNSTHDETKEVEEEKEEPKKEKSNLDQLGL